MKHVPPKTLASERNGILCNHADELSLMGIFDIIRTRAVDESKLKFCYWSEIFYLRFCSRITVFYTWVLSLVKAIVFTSVFQSNLYCDIKTEYDITYVLPLWNNLSISLVFSHIVLCRVLNRVKHKNWYFLKEICLH